MFQSASDVSGQTVSTAQPAPAGTSGPSIDYDAFLRLLIATMRNQDPTKPNDPAQMLSQLASFSVVEQGIKTNSKLDSMLTVLAGNAAAAFIGLRVESSDGAAGGIIKAVELSSSGLILVTESGQRLTMSDGVRVSQP